MVNKLTFDLKKKGAKIMKVKREYLIPGCMVSENIYKRSNTPIMRKKTVLTSDSLKILKIFMVESVHVESQLVNGEPFKPKEILSDENCSNVKKTEWQKTSFINRYLKAVQQYKKLFKDWQGGTKVDAYAVRKIFLPLYELTPGKDELLQLHHYSTKSDYIYHHAVAVSVFSFLIGKLSGFKNGDVIQLGIAGLLSDCGMAKLSYNVFEKKGPLNASEYNEVKKHPVLSYRMLEELPGLSKHALLGVLQHHERGDGSGYPLQVKGDKLHHYAKIIAVADMFHAMTSETQYRSKQSPYKAIYSLMINEFGRLDRDILNKFIQMTVDLSIGRKVRLNNGHTGEVLYQNKHYPVRPVVKLSTGEIVDLAKNPEIIIQEEYSAEQVSEGST